MTLEERLDKAKRLRAEGYNCAQTVIMCFPDATGLDDATAASLSMALGSGVAATGEICGVPNAIAIVKSLAAKSSDPAMKAKITADARIPVEEFKNLEGCITCRELKRPGAAKTCNQLIFDGIKILHENLQA